MGRHWPLFFCNPRPLASLLLIILLQIHYIQFTNEMGSSGSGAGMTAIGKIYF